MDVGIRSQEKKHSVDIVRYANIVDQRNLYDYSEVSGGG